MYEEEIAKISKNFEVEVLSEEMRTISEERVKKLEHFFSLSFPDSFRVYLTHFGNVSLPPREYSGIPREASSCSFDIEEPGHHNLTWLTEYGRENYKIDRNVVLFCYWNGEELYGIDCSKKDKCSIVVFDLEEGEVSSFDYDSFFDFLIDEYEQFG